MGLPAITIAALFGLSSASTAAEQTACLTAVECLQKSQSLGIAGFAMGKYDVDGCYSEGDSAYFGVDGTFESMSVSISDEEKERIWCSTSPQQDTNTETQGADDEIGNSSLNATSLPNDLTNSPTRGPSLSPSPKPSTAQPSRSPFTKPITQTPTFEPSRSPTAEPSGSPTYEPIAWPTYVPTESPSSQQPTKEPSKDPTPKPTNQPTRQPTKQPTKQPTRQPTNIPTKQPSNDPTEQPTPRPTPNPTANPTKIPTPQPSPSVSSESAMTTTVKACRTQKACNSKRIELGYDKFYVGSYNVKGCFVKDNVAYFGRGGTLDQKSETSLPGQLERLWCSGSSGDPAPTDPLVEGNNLGFIAPPEQHCIDIEVTTDRYGRETGFSLFTDPKDGSAPEKVLEFPVESLEGETTYTEQRCVPTGRYVFTVEDNLSGLCCSYGEGSYSVSIDGEEVISGGNFQAKKVSYKILAGYNPGMNDRDNEWLEAHNTRREEFHTEHSKKYRPLKWSSELAADAANWVEKMLPTCQMVRETNLAEGENMAINRFHGPSNNENPEQILTRWADTPLELGKGYPENIALTQVMWRATRYVGCSDKMSILEDGSYCYASVCRYVRAGNCSMRQFDSWLEPTLKDRTGCGKSCPEEGCY